MSSEANDSTGEVDLKKVLHQIVNLPQRFFSEFFELAAQYNLRHEPRFSLIGDESMVSIKMYLPGKLIIEYRLGLSYPKTPPLFFVHALLNNISKQLQLEWNLQLEQKIDRLNYAMKRVIAFNENNKKAHFYFAYGRDGVAETIDEDVAAKNNNLRLMLTNLPLDGAYVENMSSDEGPEDEPEKEKDMSQSESMSESINGSNNSMYSEQSGIETMTFSGEMTESVNESSIQDYSENLDIPPKRDRINTKRNISNKRKRSKSAISESVSHTESISGYDSEASSSRMSGYRPSNKRQSMNKVASDSPSTSERGQKRKSRPQSRDRTTRFSSNKELGYYLADRQGKNFQVVPKSVSRTATPKQMLRFKNTLSKITLKSRVSDQKQYLVFSILHGKKITPMLKTKAKKGEQKNYDENRTWKLKSLKPEKLALLIQLKAVTQKNMVEVSEEIGYVKMNFVSLATGPVTNKLDILSNKDYSLKEGVVSFDLDIREYFKKTTLKLTLTVDPAPKIKFDTGLYCQIWYIEDDKEGSQIKNNERLVVTSRPLMKIHSLSWNLSIDFPKANLKKLINGSLVVKLLSKQINQSEIEALMSKNDTSPSLTYSTSIINIEDIFPVEIYDGVEFRATLKTPDEKTIVGDLFGVATWLDLPLRAQLDGGQYESKIGIINGVPIKGALSPQQKGPLNASVSLLAGTLEQIMAAQKEEHPDLNVPFILHYLADIVENKGGLNTEGIFNHTFPPNTLRETIWELQKGNFKTVLHPREAASLIKSWLRNIDEPVIPKKEYDTCLRNCHASPDTLAQIIAEFPKENQNLLFFLIDLLRKVEQHKKYTKMDFHTLAVVMAPCICRCPGTVDSFLQVSTREIEFVENLLENLGTELKRKSRKR